MIYGQRTLDGRFAFGGRAGYFFGSERKTRIDPADPVFERVEGALRELFPQLSGIAVTHRWGGLMGAPRHWRPSVVFDRNTGFGAAGGYVGEGVAAANLAGRIMADLVLEEDTERTRLAWVGDRAPLWEPEPLRWLGARAIEFCGARADAAEFRSGKRSRFWGGMFRRLLP